MTASIYGELWKQIEALEIDEQLRLAAHILERARQVVSQEGPQHKWADVCGLYPHPILGEDAQAWVSRTRHESDERRAQSWKHTESISIRISYHPWPRKAFEEMPRPLYFAVFAPLCEIYRFRSGRQSSSVILNTSGRYTW